MLESIDPRRGQERLHRYASLPPEDLDFLQRQGLDAKGIDEVLSILQPHRRADRLEAFSTLPSTERVEGGTPMEIFPSFTARSSRKLPGSKSSTGTGGVLLVMEREPVPHTTTTYNAISTGWPRICVANKRDGHCWSIRTPKDRTFSVTGLALKLSRRGWTDCTPLLPGDRAALACRYSEEERSRSRPSLGRQPFHLIPRQVKSRST
jgi:hypothetical protein